jgi:uncharacterized protein YjaZ
MTIYKYLIRQTYEVTEYIKEEFDTDDSEQWNSLKLKAKGSMNATNFQMLPADPPEDIEVWFDIYKKIDSSNFTNIQREVGDITVEYAICDEENNIIIED